VVFRVVKDIADEQNDGFVAVVLPPMRCPARLRPDVAGLMHNWIGAVAGVFDDLALGDVDDRRSIGVAVPGHDAARLDRELAEAQLALFEFRRLLLEIDGSKHRVGYALAGMACPRTRIGFEFAGGGFARGRPPDTAHTLCP